MITARSATLFSRPLHGLPLGLLPIPAMNRWAIFNRPLNADWARNFSCNRTVGGFLFVFVRVISWIVLHFSAKQAIHEITRTDTKLACFETIQPLVNLDRPPLT